MSWTTRLEREFGVEGQQETYERGEVFDALGPSGQALDAFSIRNRHRDLTARSRVRFARLRLTAWNHSP